MIAWSAVVLMGTVLGMLGGGGAILTVPILVHLFKIPALQATHYSMLVVGIGAAVGAWTHFRRGEVALRTAVVFAIPSLVGVALSRRILLPMIPDPLLGLPKGSWVIFAFAGVMLLAGGAMWRPSRSAGRSAATQSGSIQAATRGFGVGLVTGFVGAGGGFLIVPALAGLLGLPMRVAVGTSMAIIVMNSAMGFSAPFVGSPDLVARTPWTFLAQVAGVGVLGILVGTRLAERVKPESLKRAFGAFVIVMAATLVILELR